MALVMVQLSTKRSALPAILNIGFEGFGTVDEKIMFLNPTVFIVSEVYVKTLLVPVLLMTVPSSPTKVRAFDNWVDEDCAYVPLER